MTDDGANWEEVPSRDMVKAMCPNAGCYRLVAVYVTDSHGDRGTWEPSYTKGCQCQPPPTLPAGAELAGHVARALERGTAVRIRAT